MKSDGSNNYTYILRCVDGTLYTGWTNDLQRRIQAHNDGAGAKYTKSRLPVELVYCEKYGDKKQAQQREYAIKQLSRAQKERLIGDARNKQTKYFGYGEKETEYLRRKDKRLGEAIERIGHIHREVDSDIFTSIVHNIVGQQISSAALKTVWTRINGRLGDVSVKTIYAISREELQSFGITFKKADYIKDFAEKVHDGKFVPDALRDMDDAEVMRSLTALKGIGEWTAEMLMIFCLQRPDVMSYGDLAIHRGMRMLYHHRKIDCKLFERYANRYSPYGTVASLYLWAIAGGTIPEMRDFALKSK